MRTLIMTHDFEEFYDSLPLNVQDKVDVALQILSERKIISTKFVKKLVSTEFYELRVSVGNEYRVIMFAIDHDNIIEAEQVILLNGFLKKSTKDYQKAVRKAQKILDEQF